MNNYLIEINTTDQIRIYDFAIKLMSSTRHIDDIIKKESETISTAGRIATFSMNLSEEEFVVLKLTLNFQHKQQA